MRKGQGLPVNMIVLTALALLVLVVVGAFFISGFGQASSSVTIVEASQAQCQGICQELASMAYNYDDCLVYGGTSATTEQEKYSGGVGGTSKAREYACTCNDYGACAVTLRGGKSCSISQATYDSLTTSTGAAIANPTWTLGTSTKSAGMLCYDWL